MPKRLLLIVVGLTLFSIVASLGGAFIVHDVLISGLNAEIRKEQRQFCEHLVDGLHNNLIIEDFRQTTLDLGTSLTGTSTALVRIEDVKGRLRQEVAISGRASGSVDERLNIVVPVWYDVDGGELWGRVVFLFEPRDSARLRTIETLLVLFTCLCIVILVIFGGLLFVTLEKEYRLYRRMAARIVDDPDLCTPDERLPLPIFSELHRLAKGLREKTAALRRTSQLAAVGQTTAMLAHDLRKPFTAIKALLERFEERAEKDSNLGTTLARISDLGARAETMLDDLLAATRSRTPQIISLDIAVTIDQALRACFAGGTYSAINLECRYHHCHSTMADPTDLVRVLCNLLQNAAEAEGEQGSIVIATADIERDGRFMTKVTISNQHSFISEDRLTRIFEPFYTEGKSNGTGLGLAICHKIVLEHNGSIEVRSTREDGTTFGIMFQAGEAFGDAPRTYPTPTRLAELAIQTAPPCKATMVSVSPRPANENRENMVLIVDDDEFFREVYLEFAVSQLGESLVTCASSYSAAREILENNPVKLVLTDWDLGDNRYSGIDLAEWIKLNKSGVKIVLISNAAKEVGEDGVRRGLLDHWIQAPLSRATFRTVVERFLNQDSSTSNGKH